MYETFEQLINRLSGLRGLEWMGPSGSCGTKEMAIDAIRGYLEDGAYNRYTSNNAKYALYELDKFDNGSAPATDTIDSQYWGYEIDWGDAKDKAKIKVFNHSGFTDEMQDKSWQPTEQDYRECCGVWVTPSGFTHECDPDYLLNFDDRDDFDLFHDGEVRIEPMPEQCIPKAEPKKESYQIKFPLLAGILE